MEAACRCRAFPGEGTGLSTEGYAYVDRNLRPEARTTSLLEMRPEAGIKMVYQLTREGESLDQ
jgi:hypothetical protein